MKVAKWYNNQDIRIEETETPQPGPEEILIRVIACGICGSDIVEWYRLPRAPLVQGHEIGAEVAAVGESVKGFKPGDRVFVAPKIPCMECDYCRDEHYPVCSNIPERLPGGFAEFVLVPESLVEHGTYLLPEEISFDHSTFIEPLACVVRAQRLAGLREGQTILVMGCGMSGLLHVKLAKANHCSVIATDINSRRLEIAKQVGADMTIDAADNLAEKMQDMTKTKADVVMVCTSAMRAVEAAWDCVDKGGAIVFFAVPGPEKPVTIPINDLWTREVRVLTSYYCGPPDIMDAMDLIKSGRIEIDDLITHRLPLKDIAEGFRLVLDGSESMKVVVRPQE
jgi:L-iditol 2-dehydrogenase